MKAEAFLNVYGLIFGRNHQFKFIEITYFLLNINNNTGRQKIKLLAPCETNI